MRIYFVCTGNTCRSAMAEAITRAAALTHIEVKSAGLFAMPNVPMSANAKLALEEQGILENHRAHAVTEEDIAWADYVLAMTLQHKQMLMMQYPQYGGKIYQLHEFVSGVARDVHDPYGGDIATYRATLQDLQQSITQLLIKE